ncbi:hypothetical protein AVEN_70570-1 [Araneus ventricosus]|uniref:Uncharacterized protein n=1 Tax=Araneus ventricosus TaxID=182803 RepID=A0A4Y2WRX8_ARAVE|nr:hypothetical protein AVEN_185516-1 [Araneus ventricosus]GBO40304.1 hypothetical protein AVEN_70570-1 [Araneus ventricosus]
MCKMSHSGWDRGLFRRHKSYSLVNESWKYTLEFKKHWNIFQCFFHFISATMFNTLRVPWMAHAKLSIQATCIIYNATGKVKTDRSATCTINGTLCRNYAKQANYLWTDDT